MLVICDIDGTLFNNEHRAEFIPADKSNADNWRRFNELHIYDQPIHYRLQFLRLLDMIPGVRVVYLTGRSDEFRDETQSCLNLIQAPKGDLFMRHIDDHRPAAELKLDVIGRITHSFGTAKFALIDDDLSVCHAVAAAYKNAHIVKVPSQDCAYLATANELEFCK